MEVADRDEVGLAVAIDIGRAYGGRVNVGTDLLLGGERGRCRTLGGRVEQH
jgi:hypothetical protein